MKRINRSTFLVAIILLIGLGLRVWGLNYDLPYVYHPDEPFSLSIIQSIFKTGDLNPHFFNYPSLFFYVNALAYIPFYIVGKILAIFTSRNDILSPISIVMGVVKTPMPSTVILNRLVSVIFGVGCVGLTYLIGKQLTNKVRVGALAALLLAISLPNVSLSRFITPDTFVVFLVAATFLACVLIYQRGLTRDYLIAGLCVGLTASTKYNGVLIVVPLILAHFLRQGRYGLKHINLYLALLASLIGFLVATPYAVLDFQHFWPSMESTVFHYSTGHPGMEGHTLQFYLSYMWQTGGILYIISVLGLLHGIYRRSKEIILLASFPIVYFALIANMTVRNDRTFLPLTPFLFILAASFVETLIASSANIHTHRWRNISVVGAACLAIIIIIIPAGVTIKNTLELTAENSRQLARIWIVDNLPEGAKIAVESYSPFVNPGRYSVEGFIHIIDHTPDWYIKNGFNYLVFSEGMYYRFFSEPDQYRAQVAQYNEFFDRFAMLKLFDINNYEIRIYKVTASPLK